MTGTVTAFNAIIPYTNPAVGETDTFYINYHDYGITTTCSITYAAATPDNNIGLCKDIGTSTSGVTYSKLGGSDLISGGTTYDNGWSIVFAANAGALNYCVAWV